MRTILGCLRTALIAALLPFSSLVSAAVYTLPGSLPSGCSSSSSTSYSCSTLSLDWNDSIVVLNANTTLTITNTLTAYGNSFNASSPVSGFAIRAKTVSGSNYLILNGDLTATSTLTLSSNSNSITGNVVAGGTTRIGGGVTGTLTTTGALTTEWATSIGGDVSAKSVSSGGGSTYGGSLEATGGSISLGSSDVVKGSLTATGNITSGSVNSIAGDVTSSAGNVILNSSNTTVGGGVTASGDVTVASSATVTGNVVSSGGSVTLKSSTAKVGGSVSARDQVYLENGTEVVGSVTSSNSNVVMYSSSASVGKCVTVDSSHWIWLDWKASVGGVCCDNDGTCGTSCVYNYSGSTMPSVCSSSTPCVDYSPSSSTLDTTLWNAQSVSGSFTPAVATVSGQKRLRLTSNGTNQSTLLQLKKWFPAAGNKIIVKFDYYVYGGSGADGMAVVFSDPTVALSAGAYGGSLGYAQKTGVNGFGGGWLAVGLDEYGGFANDSEGRSGYPPAWTAPSGANSPANQRANAVSVRGSGSGATGYALLASTPALSPRLWTSSNSSSTHQTFRITIDHSNSVNAYVTVERDSSGAGSSFSTVVPKFDVKASGSGQAAVPKNWLLSFTGATGDNTNFHEIANLSVCATYVNNPGGSATAANFECLETGTVTSWSTTERKPLYTKLVDTDFKFDVVALKSDGTIESDFVGTGADAKSVTVGLYDDSVLPATCSAYANPVATQALSFASTDVGRKTLTDAFKLSTAYPKLRCRVTDATIAATPVYGCSTDQFAVRPSAVTLATAPTMASGPSSSAANPITAGGAFKLRATTSASSSYSGSLAQDSSKLTAQITSQDTTQQSGGIVGALTPTTLTANAAEVAATYSEVGYLYLAAGAYRDETYTAVDRATGDCLVDTTSGNNLADTLVGGKYGCDIGNKSAVVFGRFIPDHFAITPGVVSVACGAFTYFGQDGFTTPFTLTAQNAANGTTQNYSGVFAKLGLASWSSFAFAASLPTGATLAASATAPSGSWIAGVAAVSAKHQVGRPSALAGETAVTVTAKPVDSDGVTIASAGAVQTASTPLRYGRLLLSNVFGSAKADLKMPVQAQYWTGKTWVLNSADSCTKLQASAFALSPAGVSTSPSAVSLSSGTGWVSLAKPVPETKGYVDVAANLGTSGSDLSCLVSHGGSPAGLPWLRSLNGNCSTAYDRDPSARANFGLYSPEAKKTVHVRELLR